MNYLGFVRKSAFRNRFRTVLTSALEQRKLGRLGADDAA